MAGARKKRSSRGGPRRATPPARLLENDLQRRQLARDQRDSVLDSLDLLIDSYPKIAARRGADRRAAMNQTAGELLGWAALIAERGEDHLPERLFAASCLLTSPCDPWWSGLVLSGLGAEVRSFVERRARTVDELGLIETDQRRLDRARAEALPLTQEVRELIDARTISAPDVLPVATEMLLAAIAEPLEPDLRADGWSRPAAALWLLQEDLPVADEEVLVALARELDEFIAAFPSMLEHAHRHVEDPTLDTLPDDSNGEDDEDGEDDELDLADDDTLAGSLRVIDQALSVTDDPGEAAELARVAGGLLAGGSGMRLDSEPGTFDVEYRLYAANLALRSASEWESATVDMLPEELREPVRAHLRRTASWLEADLPAIAPAVSDPTEHLSRLDQLIESVIDACESEGIGDDLPGSLGLAVLAAEVLRIGVELDAGSPDVREALARALGALDPLSLAPYPELRLRAGAQLRELAERRNLVVAR